MNFKVLNELIKIEYSVSNGFLNLQHITGGSLFSKYSRRDKVTDLSKRY